MAEPLTRVDSAVQGLPESEVPANDENTLTRVDSAVQGLAESPTDKSFNRIDSGIHDVSSSPTEKRFERIDSGVHDLSSSPPQENLLERIDSGVQGLDLSPKDEAPKKKTHRRESSIVSDVQTMRELKNNRTEIQVAKESQGTGWKINTSPTSVDDKDVLGKPLIKPLVKAVNLYFESGVVVKAKAAKTKPPNDYVTIRDALQAIYKTYKNRADDELVLPYLKGFEWRPVNPQVRDDPTQADEEWDRLYIHLSATPGVSSSGGGKKKKKNSE